VPKPVSVAVASAETCPPWTVNTVFMASMNPPRFVTWLVGGTSRIAGTRLT
jgi:hypothetical protein